MKRIAVLGSTGSIGVNTLEVIKSGLGDKYKVVALSADTNVKLLAEQSRIFRPDVIVIGRGASEIKARGVLPSNLKVLNGGDGLVEIAGRKDVDTVVFAISGTACLPPLVRAIKSGKEIALANKESLVSAGSIIMPLARKYGVRIIPIDSEHSAIFQCIDGKTDEISRIFLTASGGPLRTLPKKSFDRLSLDFILKHPKWKMGKKISVDSATMMNKGLEIIEAHHLFGIVEDRIDVLIHPEAIVHSMVGLVDGSVLAQMSNPDMRLPIQYALTYPDRRRSPVKAVDFCKLKHLSFLPPDTGKFPCLGLARRAIRVGGTMPAVLNAANEEAVRRYLEGAIKFSLIPKVIEKVISRHKVFHGRKPTLADVFTAEAWAKEEARSLCCH
ncbi:MAG TPA: 1-deoxy-D-xylulose-5-phosphate reductoisomerase [Candidatus Omnitrophota bacterium]|nr:1-deoxy-D-xylulose-5-phosphate reductoisomerase [Candidatus Omnitrophota bacterium]